MRHKRPGARERHALSHLNPGAFWRVRRTRKCNRPIGAGRGQIGRRTLGAAVHVAARWGVYRGVVVVATTSHDEDRCNCQHYLFGHAGTVAEDLHEIY